MDQGLRQLLEAVFKRIEFLGALAQKRELVDLLNVSRSTVNRAIQDLEAFGLVTYENAAYRLTVPGRLLHEQYAQYEASVRMIAAATDLLQLLPASAPISVDFLRGADVFVAEDPAPHVPASVLTDVIRDADRLRGISRTHAAPSVDDALQGVVAAGGTIEIVFREGVYEHVRSTYDWVADRVAAGDYRPYVIDDLPYGLAIADHADEHSSPSSHSTTSHENTDEHSSPNSHSTTSRETADETYTCLIVYDNTTIAGVLVNDTDAAVSWATDIFESYRRQADSAAELGAE
jgi:predicted transcriptional regulator